MDGLPASQGAFRDRADAAARLAERLSGVPLRRPLVLGIPRGGVVLAAELARRIDADLDVVLARKLRAPGQPELAIGAISEDGAVTLNDVARSVPGLTEEYLQREQRVQMEEIERRQRLFRNVRPAAPVEGRSVILTDDGIATGSTMLAALDVLRHRAPHETIVAVPVAPPDRLDPVRSRCDRLICLLAPATFWAVGQFYDRFDQVTDQEVVELLRDAPAPARQVG
ncbi:MAG: phosphoribosyltransferase [Planctomycetota bacterium]|jgi:predicted phosphoribosyltransferase